jgi:uncharacterized protein (DUF58 family)
VLLDTSADPYTDATFEDAVRVAASLARAAWMNHQPVELHTTSGRVTTAEARGGEFRDVLDILAEVAREEHDRGMREVLRLRQREDGVSLAVVTGRARAEQLWVLRQVTAAFQGIALVSLTGEADARAVSVPGVLKLTVRSSAEFAEAWPKVVRR